MRVFVHSPDVAPNMGLPATSPALRAFGLHQGFRRNGLESYLLVEQPAIRAARRAYHAVAAPTIDEQTLVVSRETLQAICKQSDGDVFVFNALNQGTVQDFIGPRSFLITDFLADLRLERPDAPAADISKWNHAYRRSFRTSDMIISNGEKKRDIVYAELDSMGIMAPGGVATIPHGMDLGSIDKPDASDRPKLRIFIAGRVQPWQRLGKWPFVLLELLGRPEIKESVEIVLALVRRKDHVDWPIVSELAAHPNVRPVSDAMSFTQYLTLLKTTDIVIDLHTNSPERLYAMSTRGVTALSAGIPLIHQYGTELEPYLSRHNAGAVLNVEDTDEMHAVFLEFMTKPATIETWRRGVRSLFDRELGPKAGTSTLSSILRSLGR